MLLDTGTPLVPVAIYCLFPRPQGQIETYDLEPSRWQQIAEAFRLFERFCDDGLLTTAAELQWIQEKGRIMKGKGGKKGSVNEGSKTPTILLWEILQWPLSSMCLITT